MTLTKTQCRQIRGIIGKMMAGPTLRIKDSQSETMSITTRLSIEDDMLNQYSYWAAMYVMNELNGMLPENEKINFSKPTK